MTFVLITGTITDAEHRTSSNGNPWQILRIAEEDKQVEVTHFGPLGAGVDVGAAVMVRRSNKTKRQMDSSVSVSLARWPPQIAVT